MITPFLCFMSLFNSSNEIFLLKKFQCLRCTFKIYSSCQIFKDLRLSFLKITSDQYYAIKSQQKKRMATHRNTFDRNCSSSYWGVPRGAALGLGSPKLKVDVKNPNGKAPIPNDMWKPPSPNPKPGKPPLFSGSERCPGGRGGTLFLGSSCLVLPLPYRGTTFSLLMAALQTGHTCRFGRVSNHWCKHGQQNKCPHMLTTASLAVSRQILHSNILSSFSFSSPLLFLEEPGSLAAAILALNFVQLQPHDLLITPEFTTFQHYNTYKFAITFLQQTVLPADY